MSDLLCRTGSTYRSAASAGQAAAVVAVIGRHAFLPSDAWRTLETHWHGYLTRRERGSDRYQRLATSPDAVLYTPDEAAEWIDRLIRTLGNRRKVWTAADQRWVEIGDDEDRAHLYDEHILVTARGDSLYTDIYSDTELVELFVEAVTPDVCPEH